MNLKHPVKRLAIYFFFDAEGVVDRYVDYLLEDLKRNVDEVLVVVNGSLQKEGKLVLEKHCPKVLVRENVGFDVWAYKAGIDAYGWDKLNQFDEVILLNSTIMGPVYPFSEMFEAMAERDLDFWGITAHDKLDQDPFGCCPYGTIPEHIQSHFTVFRSSLLKHQAFQSYWNDLSPIHSYEESVGKHEAFITKYFADLGFQWDTYVPKDYMHDYTSNLVICYPKNIIEKLRCPIFKRRCFFQDLDYLLTYTLGDSTRELFEFLRDNTDYDTTLILDNILRTCNLADVVKALQPYYVLDTMQSNALQIETALKEHKAALIIHLYSMDLMDEIYSYAQYWPQNADIYITTNTPEKRDAILGKFSSLNINKLEVRIIKNRGRDVSALLVGVKDIINKYTYLCYLHDKKTDYLNPGTVGEGFAYKCFQNTLASSSFINNIIQLFEDNPRIGLITMPEPNHADFFPHLANEWENNYDATVKLASKLKLHVPIQIDKEPVAPYGSYFWFRSQALKPLFDADWQYSDFPPEPMPPDGTLLHAIERIYPYVAQHVGFYTAVVTADTFFPIEYTNLYHYARGYGHAMADNQMCGQFFVMRDLLRIHWKEFDDLTYLIANHAEIRGSVKFNRQMVKRVLTRWLQTRAPWFIYASAVFVKRILRGPKNIKAWPGSEEKFRLRGGRKEYGH